MKLVSCAWLLASFTLATAGPVYPQRLPHRTKIEKAQHEADFRKRNPVHWTDVRTDDFGFIQYAFTDDAAFAKASVAELREFARRNADLFEIEASAIDRLDHQSSGIVEVVDVEGNNVRGQLDFHQSITNGRAGTSINALPWLEPKAKIADADVVKRLDGARYLETTTYGYPPMRDCAMSPGGTKNCVSRPAGAVKREITLASTDVRVVTYYHLEADELREVKCVDTSMLKLPIPPPDPKWHDVRVVGHELAPKGGAAALPLFIDAVTGSVVTLPAKSCNELRNVR